ncbi:hypothetical protein A6A08_01435 [Nocardiopsis sp. TSRI0078]|uniref:hypothetical protein n=1 Tax=unclassified Nocardiopsis TaxID=2649073 RepID=UPI00093ED3D1|nr:hypothetical protein [Nocardiopsis sp. TSRI0078]OKI23478.1 hypothetical protein A6A08_01435 [Nocardiopsis sp. TSRI0078]
MKHKRSTFLTTALAAAATAALLHAQPAWADTSCLSVPTDPALSASGTHVSAGARNGCGALTVLWLVRLATPTQPRTIQERALPAGTEGTVHVDCRRTGTHSYQAVVWDPNMMFNRTSSTVTLTC